MCICVYVFAQSVRATTEGRCRQCAMPRGSACAALVSGVLGVIAASLDTTPSPTVKVKCC